MEPNIVYRLATPKDRDLVLKFFREHFYSEIPLRGKQDTYDEEDDLSKLDNDHQTSFLALCDDQIVGVMLSEPKGRDQELHLLQKSSRYPGTNYATRLIFLATLERESKVYEKYEVDKAVHVYSLGVHKKFRKSGVALKLAEKTFERGKELGYPLGTCDCTSTYIIKLCEHFKMDCVYEIPLADYRAPGSKNQVFFPSKEYQLAKTFAKRL